MSKYSSTELRKWLQARQYKLIKQINGRAPPTNQHLIQLHTMLDYKQAKLSINEQFFR